MRNSVQYIIRLLFVLICPLSFIPGTLFAQFTITSTVTNAPCSYDSAGSISVSVSGGTAPYTYLWTPGGEATSLVTGLVPGNYDVTISDNAGNDSIVSFVVGPDPIRNDTAGKITPPFCTSNGAIMSNVTGGTGSYSYAWSTGSSGFWISQLAAGDYSVIVTDANTCTATFYFSLVEVECFVGPDPYFTPNGDGFNDTWFISNAQFFPDAHLIIFDRWGTKVYDHKGTYESWDGKSYLGVPVPDAAYYYFFYQDKDDKQKASKSGSVILIR